MLLVFILVVYAGLANARVVIYVASLCVYVLGILEEWMSGEQFLQIEKDARDALSNKVHSSCANTELAG